MDVPFLVWVLTFAAIVGMLIVDVVGHVRTPQAPSLRESGILSAVYVGAAVLTVVSFASRRPVRAGGPTDR